MRPSRPRSKSISTSAPERRGRKRGKRTKVLGFKNLRLVGFKSFVDGTDLPIEIGLTGVVGPNGCGKSNLVEALRWVMGETSPKQMRGGGMEDVIFGGSSMRPARNVAEVVLTLDNTARAAPPPWTDVDEIEVSRRIERDKGSTYRINGAEVRARDVQLLFADSATGARSTAIVSQGKIGSIINAKPEQRRMILEEAAGITGLHSRRHEAELRLRGAETNLERLDDVLAALDTQLQGLKKQARQATRYRNLQDHIRGAQAHVFHLRWTDAEAKRDAGRAALAEAETAVADLTGRAAEATTAQAAAAEGLPDLRRGETEAAAKVSHFTVERGKLDDEARRVEAAQTDAAARKAQAEGDMRREDQLLADAHAAIERLAAEAAGLNEAEAGDADARDAAQRALNAARADAEAAEQDVSERTRALAGEQARRDAVERTVAEVQGRLDRLNERAAQIAADRAKLDDGGADQAGRDAAEADRAQAEAARDAARTRQDSALQAREAAEQTVDGEREAAAAADQAFARLEAEEKALADLVESAGDGDMFPPLIDAVAVDEGFEDALAAALGDDLDAPADDPAPRHWRSLDAPMTAQALPAGVRPLADVVRAPRALARRLSQIGLVDGAEQGRALQDSLGPGQRLVSRDGGLWRWDGFTVQAGTRTAAAVRLEQRNRLAAVRGEIDTARAARDAAQQRVAAAQNALADAREVERQARDAARTAETTLTTHAEAVRTLDTALQARRARADALAAQDADIRAEIAETQARLDEALGERDGQRDLGAEEQALDEARFALLEKREHLDEKRRAHDALERAADERRRRLAAIETERATWTQQHAGAESRKAELAERVRRAEVDSAELAGRPDEIAARRETLSAALDEAETARKAAADALAAGETALREADQALRAAEQQLAEARETRVRREGQVDQAQQAIEDLAERIAETLDAGPGALRAMAGLADDAPAADLDAVEARLNKLLRERDAMGPVNLRAEQEAEELSQQIEGLSGERDDLIQAIEKLRTGIAELNREGRERLLSSFREVNRHFQELFVRLFGGGTAHLKLIENDDPLNAGLEIMASPPGKTLTSLSLLSGGEQALTALSLLFAVFQTNPAPICVLDEVDAPLDDANVDRFCAMLEEMVASGTTKFLVVTHHRMSMARMERLFGVTMAERGVSQLVSVDLAQAEAIRATA
jgi:chromosome segregation protein